jgi:CheY-like chemotaxis protein
MSSLLCADDDEHDVFFLQRALSGAGITNPLRTVQNGREAIAYLSGEGPYADRDRFPLPFWVFLDLYLPRTPGPELVKWIRGRPEFDPLFLVVLTGSESEHDMRAVLRAGANGYLFKPPKPDTIRQLMAQYLAFAQARGLEPQINKAKG